MPITALTESTAYTPVAFAQTRTSTQESVSIAKLELPRLDLPAIELPTRESLARDTASFAADVGKKFREAGIRVPPDPVLGNDFQGYVRVVNEHPNKDKIEQLFKDNPDLQQRYVRISSGSSLLRASEHYSQYANQHEQLKNDPAALRALAEAQIARNQAPFYLTISADGAEPFFGISRTSA